MALAICHTVVGRVDTIMERFISTQVCSSHHGKSAISRNVKVTEFNLQIRGNIPSRFSSNYEASASELLIHFEEMFSRYYMNGGVISGFKSSIR